MVLGGLWRDAADVLPRGILLLTRGHLLAGCFRWGMTGLGWMDGWMEWFRPPLDGPLAWPGRVPPPAGKELTNMLREGCRCMARCGWVRRLGVGLGLREQSEKREMSVVGVDVKGGGVVVWV